MRSSRTHSRETTSCSGRHLRRRCSPRTARPHQRPHRRPGGATPARSLTRCHRAGSARSSAHLVEAKDIMHPTVEGPRRQTPRPPGVASTRATCSDETRPTLCWTCLNNTSPDREKTKIRSLLGNVILIGLILRMAILAGFKSLPPGVSGEQVEAFFAKAMR